MTWRTLAIALGLCGLLLWGPTTPARARPPHKKALADYFGPSLAGKLNDCRTCHVPEDPDEQDASSLDLADKPHNAFGARVKAVKAALRKAGKKTSIAARLEAIADEDSDGDGVPNFVELLTGHYPGEPDDVPSALEVAEGRQQLARFRQTRGGYEWAPFDPVKRPAVPDVRNSAWVRNPIDAFLAAEHEARGLTPRPEASKPVLLRRVYLDLVGLPPSRDELRAFLDDDSPEAYERVVDRLLASPQYGERWGRHWMDVWRYSDWAGYGAQVRDSLPHIWHWRDWIIESLNADKPYDRMIVEMLAADEAAPEDPSALRATGYLVRNYKLLSREKWMQDVVDHTAQAFLGVTLGCARCHDHMYDPITQKEYYQVRAIFEPHNVRTDRTPGEVDTKTAGLPRAYDANLDVKTFLFIRGDDRNPAREPLEPGVPDALGGHFPKVERVSLPRSAYLPDRRDFVIADDRAASQTAVAQARQALAAAAAKAFRAAPALTVCGIAPAAVPARGEPLRKAIQALELPAASLALAEAKHQALVATLEAEALEDAGRKDTPEWTRAATQAARAQRVQAVAQAQHALRLAWQARRNVKPRTRAESDLALAHAVRALASAEAQVQQPAGTSYTHRPATQYPAASTGRRLAFARWIASPENPLTARVAMNQIWMRHFGQAIVPTPNDFGRNGRPATHPALLDWLAAELMDRGWQMKPMHRLIVTSSAYRQASTPDSSNLAIDPDNTYVWRFAPRRAEAEVVRDCIFAVAGTLDRTLGGPDIEHAKGLTVPRRSLYFQHAAEKQMEFLQIFDGPSVTECYRRHETTMPQQALALANSELTLRQSRLLARSLATECGPGCGTFVEAAFEQVLSRPPTKDELVECVSFLHQRVLRYREAAPADATPSSSPAQPDRSGNMPAADPSLRARENLVHVLMNHHDFVMLK